MQASLERNVKTWILNVSNQNNNKKKLAKKRKYFNAIADSMI